MANVTVYNMEGNEVGTMELNDAVFGVEINEHLVHLAVVRQLANKRQGTPVSYTHLDVYKRQGEEIMLSANGEDEEAAMSSIERYLSNQN